MQAEWSGERLSWQILSGRHLGSESWGMNVKSPKDGKQRELQVIGNNPCKETQAYDALACARNDRWLSMAGRQAVSGQHSSRILGMSTGFMLRTFSPWYGNIWAEAWPSNACLYQGFTQNEIMWRHGDQLGNCLGERSEDVNWPSGDEAEDEWVNEKF